MFKFFKLTKKQIITLAIFATIAFVIVFAPSIAMHQWANKFDGPVGNQSAFIHIFVTKNKGVSFSMGADFPELTRTIQFMFSFIVLFVVIFFVKKKTYIFLLATISFGGFFNFFDGVINDGVLDYFQFSNNLVWSSIFNFPDVFIVGSVGIIVCIAIFEVIHDLVTGPECTIDKNLPINLFIDSTQKICYICFFQGTQYIKRKSIVTQNNLTDLIVEHIDRIMSNCKLKVSDIKNVYVSEGPGSFTGTRIGVLIAKTWANIADINLYTISSLYLQTQNDGVSILDARGSKFFTGIYKKNKLIGPIKMLSFDDAQKLALKEKIPLYKDYEDIDIFSRMFFHINDFVKTDINTLKPLYVKEPL
ncbi:MAG: hypothetical protein Ta2E_05360 [Mycoplasmoidaceae bacterium]|nr:MAG: hypothetical protein Ta2E_05360 [Mycoplasmoidaceae bacterium]